MFFVVYAFGVISKKPLSNLRLWRFMPIAIFSNLLIQNSIWYSLLFIYLVLSVLGLCCCMPAFSSWREWGLLFVVVGRLSMWWFLFLQSTGSRVCRLHSLWSRGLIAPWHAESSGSGIKPMSPALAGEFSFTVPPGKSLILSFNQFMFYTLFFIPNSIYILYIHT